MGCLYLLLHMMHVHASDDRCTIPSDPSLPLSAAFSQFLVASRCALCPSAMQLMHREARFQASYQALPPPDAWTPAHTSYMETMDLDRYRMYVQVSYVYTSRPVRTIGQ